MLPDLRVLLGSTLAALLLLTASLGMFASLRVAQDRIDPLARTSLTASRSIVLQPRDGPADGNKPEQIAEIAGNPPETTASISHKTAHDTAAAPATAPAETEPAATPAQDAKASEPMSVSDPEETAASNTLPAKQLDSAERAPVEAALDAAPADAVTAPDDQPGTTASIPANLTRLPKARPHAADLAQTRASRGPIRTAKRRIARSRARPGAVFPWPGQQPQWRQPIGRQRQTRNNNANSASAPFAGLFGNDQSNTR